MGHESPCHFKRAAKLEHVCYGIGAKKKTPEKIELALFSDYDNINAPASYKFKVVLPKGIEGVGYWGIGGWGILPIYYGG